MNERQRNDPSSSSDPGDADDARDDERDAIIAADDTGMIQTEVDIVAVEEDEGLG